MPWGTQQSAAGWSCGQLGGPCQALVQQQTLRCCSFSVTKMCICQLEGVCRWTLPSCGAGLEAAAVAALIDTYGPAWGRTVSSAGVFSQLLMRMS